MKIIYSNSQKPSFNLAVEEYLFSKGEEDFLLFYVNENSVILGSNQVTVNEVNLDFCQLHDIGIFRRISGGGAVFHDQGNLNYCFISDKSENKTVLNGDFLFPIIEILQSFEIPVEMGARKDLWLQGKFKISGTASHIRKNRQLHHGTLLYNSNLNYLQQSLTVNKKDENLKGIPSVPSTVTNISAYLEEKQGDSLESRDFFKAFISRIAEYFHSEIVEIQKDEMTDVLELEKKYFQPEWIFRK